MKLPPCGNDKKPPVQAICSLPRVICQYLASFQYFPIFRLLDKSNTADAQFPTHFILDGHPGNNWHFYIPWREKNNFRKDGNLEEQNILL